MVVKEAWRVERGDTGEFRLSDEQRAGLRRSWSAGKVVGSVLGAALWITLVGIVVKVLALVWAWILS
jgi:hypothetical protein